MRTASQARIKQEYKIIQGVYRIVQGAGRFYSECTDQSV